MSGERERERERIKELCIIGRLDDDDDDSCEFFTLILTGAFLLSDKSPLVSGTLLNILTYHNSAVVLTVSIFPLISTYPNFFPDLWGQFQEYQLVLVSVSCSTAFFFYSLVRSKYFLIFSLSFIFTR